MMKQIQSLLLIICLLFSFGIEAQTTVDGIKIQSSSVNKEQYLYGEPIHLYFELINTSGETKYYYTPIESVNYQQSLIRTDTKESVLSSNRVMGSNTAHSNFLRDKLSKEPPTERQAYQPKEESFIEFFLNEEFGSINLSNIPDEELILRNSLNHNLYALPEGEYLFKIEYTLLPGKEVISASHPFSVAMLPEKFEDDFKDYIKTTSYASSFIGRKKQNYSNYHEDSYENFLKKHGYQSPYAQHAYVDWTFKIRAYIEEGSKIFQEYFNDYGKITAPDVQARYVARLPAAQKTLRSSAGARSLTIDSDSMLRKMESVNPGVSLIYKRMLKFHFPDQ